MDYIICMKYPYRMQAVQVTLHTMENSSPFVGNPAPTVDRHTTASAGLLRIVMLPLRSLN